MIGIIDIGRMMSYKMVDKIFWQEKMQFDV